MSDYSVLGVGVGPANLSLAALLEPHAIRSLFLSEQKKFSWHAGFQTSNSNLQVSFLKDLVTPADPSSKHTFLSYLKSCGRLYSFIHAEFARVQRAEFADYLDWVAQQLTCLQFGSRVREIDFFDGRFAVRTDCESFSARDIVVGTGGRPNIPSWATAGHERVVHSARYSEIRDLAVGRRVCVIGGGQSGAEVALDLLESEERRPLSIRWISRRPNLLPLDESAFSNEWFRPSYAMAFHGLSSGDRESALRDQYLASNGISPDLLLKLYQRIYSLRYIEKQPAAICICPGRTVQSLRARADGLHVGTDDLEANTVADLVILCTGWVSELPSCMTPLLDRIDGHKLGVDGNFPVKADFSVCWDGPAANRIFAQNAAMHSHGVADPNLSIVAWRSAVIANAIARRRLYDVRDDALLEWRRSAQKIPEPREAAIL